MSALTVEDHRRGNRLAALATVLLQVCNLLLQTTPVCYTIVTEVPLATVSCTSTPYDTSIKL